MTSARGSVATGFGLKRWELPPLILHPFSDQSGPGKLLDSSRASLMLNGLLPSDDASEEELMQRLLEGRLCEIRMLYFVGKDLLRWTSHCVDFASSIDELQEAGVREQSFAAFLVTDPPKNVQEKLRSWGVLDYKSIFSRAMGLHAVFAAPPTGDVVSPHFVRNYYRFADHMFACRQQVEPHTDLTPVNFHFDIYASGEYSRMLERAWGE